MWEEPSEGASAMVEGGNGTHRDYIKVLMTTGWADQGKCIGAWAGHWRRDHDEQ